MVKTPALDGPSTHDNDDEDDRYWQHTSWVQDFRRLRVWQEAHGLALLVYAFTADFPPAERYGLTSQLRRAIVSVTSNIAEGAKRVSRRDYAHFLNIAEGSLAEVESLILIALDLHYLPAATFDLAAARLALTGRMLCRLRERVLRASRAEH